MSQITICDLGVLKPEKQLDTLLERFKLMQAGLPGKEGGGVGAIALNWSTSAGQHRGTSPGEPD